MKRGRIISNYFKHTHYRRSFNRLAEQTFGLDFESWYINDHFKGQYISYAYVIDEEVVANISINNMHLIVNGKRQEAIQIGTVMTQPDYRGKGLAAQLMHNVLAEYEKQCDFIYLFANDTVLDFYPKFGFKQVAENAYMLAANAITKREGIIDRLISNTEKTDTLINRLSKSRVPISQVLGVYNDEWPLGVYCRYEYAENLYYMPEEDCIVIAQRKEGRLHLYDVLSEKSIDLDKVIEQFIQEADKEIVFHFIPSLEKYVVEKSVSKREDDTLFVRGKNLDGEILFPMTSHT